VNSKIAFTDILSLLRNKAKKTPLKIAIVGRDFKEISFKDLNEQVAAFATRLLSHSKQKNKLIPLRTAIVLPNGPDMSKTLLASCVTGAAVPLNPAYTEFEFSEYFRQAKVTSLVTLKGFAPACERAANQNGLPIINLEELSDQIFDKNHKKLNLPKPSDTALILLTSGSTGRPKLVPLTHRNVCTSARDVSVSLNLSSNDRCLSMWELFHIGGLVDMLLAPLHSGRSIIATSGFSSMAFFSYSEEFSPTWFQGVPTTFFELVRYADLNSIRKIVPQQRFVRSVAAPLSIEMARHITDLFDAPVITTFGMTEAGPLITSTSLTPSNNPAGSLGKSCGTKIATVDSKWNFLGLGEEGEIIVRGENVFSGYENDPIANENIFHKDWFRTGDIGYLDQQNNLFLTGRVKEQINRGGEKINPREVDEALMAHPIIESAASYSIPHKTLGEDIAAAVVLLPGSIQNENEIRNFLEYRLAKFKIPQSIMFLDMLPTNAVGKIDRKKLAKIDIPKRAPSLEKLSNTEKIIANIWEKELGLKCIDPDIDFIKLGGDSLSAVRMILSIEKEFKIIIPSKYIQNISTVRNIAILVNKCQNEFWRKRNSKLKESDTQIAREMFTYIALGEIPIIDHGSLFKVANQDGTQTPLIWIFNSPEKEMAAMKKEMSLEQPIYGGFSGQGLVKKDTSTFEALIDLYVNEISSRFNSGSLRIGGNCHGGQLAFRIAQRLIEDGRQVQKLILLEFSDPGLYNLNSNMLLLFGRQSKLKAYKPIHWGESDWLGHFNNQPIVGWVNGFHGGLFRSENVELTCLALENFLKDRKINIQTLETREGQSTLRLHHRYILFYIYRKLYRFKAHLSDIFYRKNN